MSKIAINFFAALNTYFCTLQPSYLSNFMWNFSSIERKSVEIASLWKFLIIVKFLCIPPENFELLSSRVGLPYKIWRFFFYTQMNYLLLGSTNVENTNMKMIKNLMRYRKKIWIYYDKIIILENLSFSSQFWIHHLFQEYWNFWRKMRIIYCKFR